MPEAAEDVERRGSSVTKGELAASMASRISDSSAGASGASAIPLEPGDSMYEWAAKQLEKVGVKISFRGPEQVAPADGEFYVVQQI